MRRIIEDTHAQGRQGLVLTCKERLTHYYEKFGFHDEGESQSQHGGAKWRQMRLLFYR
jgi:predicted GNAT family N-acyltransferase